MPKAPGRLAKGFLIMGKPPAFLMNALQWLSSITIEEMTGDEVKAYLYLLCRAWDEIPIATLPNDDARLARMAKLPPDEWARVRTAVLAQFKTNGNGRIYNERLQKEAAYCKGRAFAGASGWTKERREKQAKTAKASAAKRTKQTT